MNGIDNNCTKNKKFIVNIYTAYRPKDSFLL